MRSSQAGIAALEWLNIEVALSTTSNTTTATAGMPTTSTTAILISSEIRISIGWKRTPVVTSMSRSAWCMRCSRHSTGTLWKRHVLHVDREIEHEEAEQRLRPRAGHGVMLSRPQPLPRGEQRGADRRGRDQHAHQQRVDAPECRDCPASAARARSTSRGAAPAAPTAPARQKTPSAAPSRMTISACHASIGAKIATPMRTHQIRCDAARPRRCRCRCAPVKT